MAESDPHLRESHPETPVPETPGNEPGHETGDVNVWAIGKFAFALIAIIAISLGLLVGLFKYFQTRDQANATAVRVDPVKLFPEPRLERAPIPELKTVRAEEDRMLNSYGWVDPQKNLVRVPIDVAIDLLAKKGLPSRPQGGPK
ncbi:MAG TPA: hypothetical protein VNY05_35070 [Candidatus Acidoferrales bacterium]|jgi:hypothetical protein|nr:hypothetical protein [Candidatus Acidoferrales bacterium]